MMSIEVSLMSIVWVLLTSRWTSIHAMHPVYCEERGAYLMRILMEGSPATVLK